jgi:hypothetical protein
MDQPSTEHVLKRLESLIGEWKLDAIGPDGQPWSGEATAVIEWHDSRAHIVVRSQVELPNAPDAVSIIGCDAANGTYYQLYSDARGVCRVYQMSIDESHWRLWREGQPFAQRFTATFEDGGDTIRGRWELAEDQENFRTDFDLIYRRAKQQRDP